MQISWRADRFENIEVQIWWQGQHFVNSKCTYVFPYGCILMCALMCHHPSSHMYAPRCHTCALTRVTHICMLSRVCAPPRQAHSNPVWAPPGAFSAARRHQGCSRWVHCQSLLLVGDHFSVLIARVDTGVTRTDHLASCWGKRKAHARI